MTVFLDAIRKKNENMNVEETQIKMVRYFVEQDFLAFNICRCRWLTSNDFLCGTMLCFLQSSLLPWKQKMDLARKEVGIGEMIGGD